MARILVIDDCQSTLLLLRTVLSEAGYEVEMANSGKDGLEKISSGESFDLVITDYLMPDLNGLRMVQQAINTLGSLPFPIFIHTSETSELVKAEGKALGVTAWVKKPFVKEKLVAAVQKVVAANTDAA